MPGKLVPHGDFESFIDEIQADGAVDIEIAGDPNGVYVVWTVKRRTSQVKETR